MRNMREELRNRVVVETGAVSTITLNRPAAGNALDLEMARALADAAARVQAVEGLRAVRVQAAGKAFCVGGDLKEFAHVADPSAHVAAVAEAAHEALTRLRDLEVPVVTVVQGVAAGAGVGIALAGDVVLAGSGASFVLAYTAASLSPDCGVTHHLLRLLGPARALDLALTNRSVPAALAADWGLVSRSVPQEDLGTVTDELLAQLAAGPPEALAATKQLLRASTGNGWEQQLAAEAASISRLAGSPHGREGVAAFLAKRPPVFA
jgi:2-(1,2-epoxy-1,2-dihydrophenyl)acetyl-CoA isomerase